MREQARARERVGPDFFRVEHGQAVVANFQDLGVAVAVVVVVGDAGDVGRPAIKSPLFLGHRDHGVQRRGKVGKDADLGGDGARHEPV